MWHIFHYFYWSVYIFLNFILIPDVSISRSDSHANGDAPKTAPLDVTRHTRDQGNRKRVIRMLVVIVLQYFICWTPIYLLNTWQAFDFRTVLHYISPTVKSLLLLLAYTSSFIHPITYCFMNKSFKEGFARSFKCSAQSSGQRSISLGRVSVTWMWSQISTNPLFRSNKTYTCPYIMVYNCKDRSHSWQSDVIKLHIHTQINNYKTLKHG